MKNLIATFAISVLLFSTSVMADKVPTDKGQYMNDVSYYCTVIFGTKRCWIKKSEDRLNEGKIYRSPSVETPVTPSKKSII